MCAARHIHAHVRVKLSVKSSHNTVYYIVYGVLTMYRVLTTCCVVCTLCETASQAPESSLSVNKREMQRVSYTGAV